MPTDHITENATKAGDALGRVQKLRKLALAIGGLAAGILMVFSGSRAPSGTLLHEAIEYLGILLIFACIAGRLWSSLYIAGRKKVELIQDGPYEISRNPLYLFSLLGAAGVGAATGSVTGIILASFVCFSVFSIVILMEEQFLRQRFGAAFDAYCACTPRLFPRTFHMTARSEITIDPRLIMRNFRDSSLFLLAIPMIELIEEMQEAGLLPIYFIVP